MATNVLPASRRGRRAPAVWLAVPALLLAGLAVAPAATAAAPDAPTDLSPTGAISSNSPVLSWSPVSRAVRYEVQVDDEPSFASPEFTSTTTNNRAVPLSLLRTGEQFWRVRAVNAADEKSVWRSADFLINPVAAPTPIAPVGGELLEQPEMAPLLTWEGTRGATSYTVEVDTEDDFIGAKTYTTKTTSLVVPDPLEARTYWWRVTATKAAGVVSQPSAAETFEIGALDPVVLTSPADNPDTKVEDVVLDWEPVAGAQYYQLRVDTNRDFSNPVLVDNQAKIYGTQYSPKTTYDNNQYYWQVRAVDLAGNPTPWTTVTNNFDRVWPDTPAPVYPAAPGFERVDSPLYFQWEPVQHATQYQLEVGSDEDFSPGTYESCQIAGTTYTPGASLVDPTHGILFTRPDDECVAQPGVISYWRVRPLDLPFFKAGSVPGVQGLYSQTQAFIYDPTYFVPGSVHPTNGETVDIPTLRWTPRYPAEKYKIVIRNNTGQVIKQAETRSTSYTPVQTPRLAKGSYTWTLQAIEANRNQSLIYQHAFNISGDTPTTGAPPLTPLSGRPSDGPTSDAPALSWEPYEGADHYMISAGPAGSGTLFVPQSDDVLGKKLYYPAVTDTSARFLSGGEFDWIVTAYTASGVALASTPLADPVEARFRVIRLAPAGGQQIALDGKALDDGDTCALRLENDAICTGVPSTPVLDWDPVPGARLYMVYVSEDASFTNLLEPSTAIPVTTNTRFAPTFANAKSAYADSQAGLAYYWHIRPCKTINICAADPVSSTGAATNAFRKVSPAVELLSPTHDSDPAGPNISTNEITFDWTDYFDTNQATTWAATGENSPQAAMQYRIQVDDSPTFSGTLIDDQKVDQSTYTAAHKLYPEGTLYWRVQAIDAEGNGLTWSETRSLVKSSPLVEVLAPSGGDHVSGTTPFRWTAQSFNASYRVEVFKNNDTTFSLVNRVFSKDVKTTAYAWDQPLPASPQPYVWRVRRTDASNNPGGWSVHGTFHSDGAVPTLIAPAAGVYQPANGPLFTWDSVPGATSYELEVRQDGAAFPWARINTPATAWATDKTVADGRWEWRVTARDANRNTVGVTGWRGFQVDTVRPTVTRKTPTRTALRTANFTATFSERVESVNNTTMKLFEKGKVTPLLAAVSLDSTGRKATLNPQANLKAGKYYTVKLTTGIKDDAGNTLKGASWTVRAK